MTSFLLSALASKFRRASLEEFRAVHAHCWLVWEPGVWRPPSRWATLPAEQMMTPAPSTLEALAIALAPRAGQGGQLTVGRSSASDVEVNDGTLSQLHLLLMEEGPGRFTARDAGSKNGTWVDGVRLVPGAPVALGEGARIQAAQVCLTFYTPPGMLRRLQAHPTAKPGPQAGPG
jgi:hypothetical protein